MEEKTKKIKVTRVENDIFFLSSIASNQLTKGKEEEDGFRFRWIIPSMAFSTFRIEALCNVFGSQLFPNWELLESASFLGKVTLISKILKLDVDFSKEPWQTLNNMKDFRNTLVHAKPQISRITVDIPESFPDKAAGIPSSKKTVMAKYSLGTAEKFNEIADDIYGMWLHQSTLLGHNVDVVGVVKYEIIE